MTKSKKGSVSPETFDEFLAEQGMLEACEDQPHWFSREYW